MISLVWLVELEFPLVSRPSPSEPRGRWHAQGSMGGQDQQGGWVGQKKILSVRVFAGVASVPGSRPAAVRPLAPSQRAPSPQAASPTCGPPFFLHCGLLVCVQLAKCVPKNKRLPIG